MLGLKLHWRDGVLQSQGAPVAHTATHILLARTQLQNISNCKAGKYPAVCSGSKENLFGQLVDSATPTPEKDINIFLLKVFINILFKRY